MDSWCICYCSVYINVSCFLSYFLLSFTVGNLCQLGGWAVSGQWNRTDFNSTLSLLMRDYATFPFFSLRVGRDPKETSNGTNKRYIQVSSLWHHF